MKRGFLKTSGIGLDATAVEDKAALAESGTSTTVRVTTSLKRGFLKDGLGLEDTGSKDRSALQKSEIDTMNETVPMKRGFLKDGLGLEDAQSRDRVVLEKSGTNTTTDFQSNGDVTYSTTIDGEDYSWTFPTISPSGRSHPMPPFLSLGSNIRLPHNDPFQSDFGLMKVSPNSLSRETTGLYVLGFGQTSGTKPFDTLCITWIENRLHLREHPGFPDRLEEKLRGENSKWVEVVPILGKGLALVAKRDIPLGQIFVRERPLITTMRWIPAELAAHLPKLLDRSLTPESKQAFLALFNCKSTGNPIAEVQGILHTNALGAQWPFEEELQPVVFNWMSRSNHSCSPNAAYEWNHETFCGSFRSEREIKKGEEVTIAYTPLLAPARVRKAELKEKYSFVCNCASCTLPERQQAESDRRREMLRDSLSTNRTSGRSALSKIQHGYDDSYIQRMLDMLDTEGLPGERVNILAGFTQLEAQGAKQRGDYVRAVHLAQRTIEELKIMGFEEKNHVWQRMKGVLEEKRDSLGTERSKKPSNKMTLKQLKSMRAGTSESVVGRVTMKTHLQQ